ncbi:MAG TPA: threonine/serine dehydratase [Acidimicrobiales bacterium]|nr:threonine/serine dehydratase [Acidimicrobiales bacterium]
MHDQVEAGETGDDAARADPAGPGREEITAAAHRVAPYVRHTPVIALEPAWRGVPGSVVLKLELLQHTGSFKPRGALNRILDAAVPASGVIAASGGNHGLGVAYAARALGHRAEVFVPETTSRVKIDRLHELGADVVVTGTYYADALSASERRVEETGALVVHAYDQPDVVAGQGTVGRELDDDAPGLDTVVVAVGGGGLMAGITSWFAGSVHVVAVEPEGAPTLHHALAAGHPVDVDVAGLAADSLGARRIGSIAYAVARRHRVESVLVTDDAIASAQRALWTDLHVMAEPGGAAAVAALVAGVYVPAGGERVGVVVCGGNVDPATVTR